MSHKSPDLPEALAAACPDGIDAYFENVGGKVFEAVLPLLNPRSRVSLCGLVSQYGNLSAEDPHEAWRSRGQSTFERQNVEVHQLVVGNFVATHQEPFLAEMTDWVRDGRIKYKEDLWPGLEQAPTAFRAMLEGGNFGSRRAGDNVLEAGF